MRRRPIYDIVRHERDRALRDTGQAHRYLTDAMFHASLDLVLRTVEVTVKALAEEPLADDTMIEDVARKATRTLIEGQATAEQRAVAAAEQITLTLPDPEIMRLLGLADDAARDAATEVGER